MTAKKSERAISEQHQETHIPTQNIKRKKITAHLTDRKRTRSLKISAITKPFPAQQMEEALRRSEERYRTILENIEEAYFEDDLAGNFTFVNDVLCGLLGYTREELIGKDYRQYTDEQNAMKLRDLYTRLYKTGKPIKAFDLEAIKKDGTKGIYETSISLMRDSEGKPIGFRGISRDVTERKRVEEQLLNAAQQWRTTFDGIRDIVCLLDREGRILKCNKAMTDLLGKPFSEIINRTHSEIVHGAPMPIEECPVERLWKTHHRETDILLINDRWFSIAVDPLLDEAGRLVGAVHIMSDVTERKRAEEAIRESEKRYRQVIENAVDIIYATDANGNFTYANSAVLTIAGYSLEELQRLNYLDLILPEHRDRVSKIYISQFRERQATTYVEFPFFNKSGDVLWFGQNASLVIEREKPVGFHVIARDITERKRMEEALRESEERYKALYDRSLDCVFVLDFEGKFIDANQAALTMLGYDRTDLSSLNIASVLDERDLSQGLQVINELIQTGFKKELSKYRLKHKNGGIVYVETQSSIIYRDGKPYAIQGIARDVTERKRTEEALQRSEERYRTILESIEDGYYEEDLAGNFVFFNQAMCRIYGYPKEELLGLNYKQYTDKETAKKLFQVFNEIYRTGNPNNEYSYELIRKDGAKRYIEASASLKRDSSGKPTGFRGVVRDITERKRAEQALQESEETAKRLAQENAAVAEIGRIISSTFDIEKGYEQFVEEVRKLIPFDRITITKIDPKENIFIVLYKAGPHVAGRGAGDAVPLAGTASEWVFQHRSTLSVCEQNREEMLGRMPGLLPIFKAGFHSMMFVPLISKDQVIGTLVLQAVKQNAYTKAEQKLAEKVSHQIAGAVANAQLFSERNKAEEALRRSEEKYRNILESIEDGYYEVDLAGNFTFLNDAMCRIYRYPKEELIGMNNRQYTDEKNAKHVFQAFNKLYKTGVPIKGLDYEIFRKDGTKAFTEVSVSLLRNSEGEAIGFRGISRDVTERKRAEQALQESEETAKRLAQENAIVAEIGRIVSSTLNIEEVYERFAEETRKLIPFDRITINLGDLKNNTSTTAYIAGIDVPGRRAGDITSIVGTVTEEVTRTRSSLFIQGDNIDEVASRFPSLLPTFQAGLRSMIFVPLISKDQVIGVLSLRSLVPKAYTNQDVRLAESIGAQIAGAIANAQLFIQRKRIEEALRQSEERYRTILEDIEDGYYEVDLAGTFTFLNDSMSRIFGYPKEELLGMNNRQYTDKEVAKKVFQDFNRIYKTGEHGRVIDYEITRKDGTKRYIGTSASLQKDSSGKPIGFRGIVQDITERMRAQEALRQSEERYRTILESIQDGYFEVDLAGKFTFLNDSMCRIFRYPKEELIGMNSRQYNDQENAKRIYQAFNKIYRTGEPGRVFANEITRKDGTKAITELSASLIRNSEGKPIGFRGTTRDVTERNRVEREMAELQEQLRQSQKMEAVGRLAGGIAHDFNNLLTVMKGYSQLSLLDLKESDPLRENIQEIEKATQRATDLTRQLLAFSRRQILNLKVLDLNALLKDLDKMLRRIIGEDIELVTLLSENLGRVKIDPNQIEQVVFNLAANARDAMPSGGKLTIETADVELDETYAHAHVSVIPGHYVMLSVSDTGVGMSQEVKERVFEPFFTTKEQGKGTGLGLSMVYGIVKQSNGNIWVYSEPGHGTAFKIYLPRTEEEVDASHEREKTDFFPRGSETVLLVEDDELVRDLASRLLKQLGYRVLEAADGEEGLRVAQEHNGETIHLLLTDAVMPHMGGKELSDQLKILRPDVKVLYTSGYTDETIVHHGVLDPNTHFLQKPFSPRTLSQKVREALER
jgi:PAS domain S-box-containing protein